MSELSFDDFDRLDFADIVTSTIHHTSDMLRDRRADRQAMVRGIQRMRADLILRGCPPDDITRLDEFLEQRFGVKAPRQRRNAPAGSRRPRAWPY